MDTDFWSQPSLYPNTDPNTIILHPKTEVSSSFARRQKYCLVARRRAYCLSPKDWYRRVLVHVCPKTEFDKSDLSFAVNCLTLTNWYLTTFPMAGCYTRPILIWSISEPVDSGKKTRRPRMQAFGFVYFPDAPLPVSIVTSGFLSARSQIFRRSITS